MQLSSFLSICLASGIAWQPVYARAAATDPADKPAQQWTEKERIGTDVPIEAWKDSTNAPWAVLLCIHGFSLHADSYAPFGRRMAGLGIPTYAIDVRGFGSWQNTKECARVDFEAAQQDIKGALVAIRQAHPKLPVILLGESMGGALAVQVAADNPDLVDGLICSVPSPRSSGQKSSSVKAAVGMVYAPHKPIDVGAGLIRRATKSEELQLDWENDPLSKMNLTPVELLRFKKMMNQTGVKAGRITETPVLFLQGINDRLVKPAGTMKLFEALKTPDKNLLMVGTAEHLIFEQGQFDDHIVDLVLSWIDKNVVNRSLANASPSNLTDSTSNKIGNGTHGDDETREALGHLKIAQGFLLLNQPTQARDHLLAALHSARGSALAVQADRLLLSLPEQLIAPATGPTTCTLVRPVSLDAAKANDKPSLLVFCATWIQACGPLMEQLTSTLGSDLDKVNVVMIDADDPKNDETLKEYGIKPLPAILYLSRDNEVKFYTLGPPDDIALHSRVKQLLEAEPKS